MYFDPEIHRVLRLKAAATDRSIPDLVDDALGCSLVEDAEDLDAFETRTGEPLLSYEDMLERISVLADDPRPTGCEKLAG